MVNTVETLLLNELKGLRGDVRDNTKEVSKLTEQMAHVLVDLEDAKDHGQRLALLEQWKEDQMADSTSARAERRANLALMVSVFIAILGMVLGHFHK